MAAGEFSRFQNLSQPTLSVLQRLNFTTPTPVQEAVIPLFTGNQDVAVEACTGSGKTLAYVVPVAERLRGLEEALLLHQVGRLLAVLYTQRRLNTRLASISGWGHHCRTHQRACRADTRCCSAILDLCIWDHFPFACRWHVSSSS